MKQHHILKSLTRNPRPSSFNPETLASKPVLGTKGADGIEQKHV